MVNGIIVKGYSIVAIPTDVVQSHHWMAMYYVLWAVSVFIVYTARQSISRGGAVAGKAPCLALGLIVQPATCGLGRVHLVLAVAWLR